ASPTRRSRPCAASTSRSVAARSSRSWARTARARRRRSRSSRASASATRGRSRCSARTPAPRIATGARIRVVLQESEVTGLLAVREWLELFAGYFAHPRAIDETIALVGLSAQADQRAAKLSGGQRRRLDVALGLIGSPELLFLDEPTTGFDPAARHDAWDLVRQLRAGGTTILLTTHDMAEAQALADRVVLLKGGAVVAGGPPAALRGRDAERARISFRLPPGVPVSGLPVPAALRGGAVVIETARPTEDLHRLTGWAMRRGVTLSGLTVDRPSLEDVYLRLTRNGAQSGAPERSTR